MFKAGKVQDNGQVNQIFFTTSVHAICDVKYCPCLVVDDDIYDDGPQ